MILYFTGTGNCLYVARELAAEGERVLSIPQELRREGELAYADDTVGIVYPIYGHMMPDMVKTFLERATLDTPYLYFVCTYGNRHANAVELCLEDARAAGLNPAYATTLLMVDNWLPNFDMNEQVKMDKHIPENLQKITADINGQRHWHEPVTEEERQMHRGFLAVSGLDPEVSFLMKSEKCFTVTDACIDCGICTYVCPRGNYELTPGGVKMSGDCEFCFACIQNCPQRAIQFRKSEDGSFPNGTEVNPNARYRNEHISLMDLKLANNQKL